MILRFLALWTLLGFVSPPQEVSEEGEEMAGRDMCLACHEVTNAFLGSVHGRQECEACHGPGMAHADAGGDPDLIRTPAALDWMMACQDCHALSQQGMGAFEQTAHGRNQIECLSCHQVHKETGGFGLIRQRPVSLCTSCHSAAEADFRKPFHHPVLEGGMACTDCHDPHGDRETSMRRLEMEPAYGCATCHGDKKGPFVFSHPPVEAGDCQVCHTPHGGFNSKLLVRSQTHQLCLECHSLSPGLAGSRPPAFHDIRSPRYRSCTTCHREIHGSNVHPAFVR
jgi:DmsE family decaheme c-type cytochrome